jgi:hypothetical protein
MDANSERRALRKKVLALHGAEVIGACDLAEAASICHRDRYDMVLIDIRRDHLGCIAWRDEIKHQAPRQFVAFLVGKPGYISLEPAPTSYLVEEDGAQWGDSLRKAIRDNCELLQQRNSFVEAGWRIAVGRKMKASPAKSPSLDEIPDVLREFSPDRQPDRETPSSESLPSTLENTPFHNPNSEEES